MARIRLENISKSFGPHDAVDKLDLDVADGEFFVLLGPTGAGKTTTLRMIAGLEKPTEGAIHINQVNVNDWGPAERDVALVLQQYSLYPRLTVRDNLSFPLRSELKDLQMRLGATFVFVTHDQVEAMTMGDRIGVLNRGRLVQVGSPAEIYRNPRDIFVASFVGAPAINLLPGNLAGGVAIVAPNTFELPFSGQAASEGAYTFGIRPEDVRVESGAPVEAKVHDVENHGIEKILTLRVAGQLVRAGVPAKVNVAVEDSVRFGWNPGKVMLFDQKTGLNLGHTAA